MSDPGPGARRRIRRAAIAAAALSVLTGLAILVLDAPVARAIGGGGGADPGWFKPVLHVLEVVTGMGAGMGMGTTVDRYLIALVLLGAGAVLWRWRPDPARALVLIGATNLLTRLVTTELKGATGRLRPAEALRDGVDLGATFFHGGISFPSGHVAHFAGLAVAMAVAWPKTAVPALAAVGFVAVARVATNAHFISDVTGAAALAAGFAAALATVLRVRR